MNKESELIKIDDTHFIGIDYGVKDGDYDCKCYGRKIDGDIDKIEYFKGEDDA